LLPARIFPFLHSGFFRDFFPEKQSGKILFVSFNFRGICPQVTGESLPRCEDPTEASACVALVSIPGCGLVTIA